MIENKKVVVLFSGGVDSTAVAIHYLGKGYRTFLLTFDNGAESELERSGKKALAIVKKFPTLCSWKMMSSRELFHSIAIKTLEKDVKRYGNLICCGCKLAMLAHSIVFARKRGIGIIADGYRKGQEYYPEQTPDFFYVSNKLCKMYNIVNEHPVYDMSPVRIRQIFRGSGIKPTSSQASCLFGENRLRSKKIKAYTLSKLPLAVAFIESKIKK